MALDTSPTPLSASTPQAATSNIAPSFSQAMLDTIPVLHGILNRLSTLSPNSNAQDQTSPAATNSPSTDAPLAIKDIPSATDIVKQNLQKARIQASQLPDISRTIEDQEKEIRELEGKIRAQRGVLEGLRDLGNRVAREKGDKMETTE